MLDTEKILLITPNAVKGFSVRGGEGKELVSLSWTPETIGRVLETARAATGRNVRLLVGEPFAYVTTLFLPEKETYSSPKEEREAVFRLAGALVPEELEKTSWDYREVSLPASSLGRPVEVVAIIASFARVVAPAVKEAGFRVLATLPESCALALLLSDRKDPLLVVYKSDGFFLSGMVGGIVLSSVTSFGALSCEAIETFARFLESRFSLSFKTVVFSGDFSERDLASFDREKAGASGFSIEALEKSAMFGLAEKRDVSGDDRSVLSISLEAPTAEETVPDEAAPEESRDVRERFRFHVLDERSAIERATKTIENHFFPKFSRRTSILAAIFFVILLSGAAAIWFLKKERSEKMETSDRSFAVGADTLPLPAPSPSDSVPEKIAEPEIAEPEASPSFNRASFRVVILNGSGVSGAAVRLEKVLIGEGFVIEKTGNAESAETISFVRAKASVPGAFLDELVSVSGLGASLDRRPDISEESEADVILVIGTEK